jgi:1-deoxy-D-xylulose-5-phosphate reductoisomerase
VSKKHIAILGSTGSIGTQTLEVISEHPDQFVVEVLTANHNVELLIAQSRQYIPNVVVIANELLYPQLKVALSDLPIKVFAGADSITQVVAMETVDIVLTAMVGFSGLLPTINAIKHRKIIALANKETLVVAGELIQNLVSEYQTEIRPVDSEHSAIYQCLVGEFDNPIEKIYLTASGGPFRNLPLDDFAKITLEQALKHPNWNMGNKITIDSASMMNKGLEAIEAKWLFNLKPDQIDILIHPQSIVHSMVQFTDGSIKAQMGLPDMKLPIQFALTYPDRIQSSFPRMDFGLYPQLDFKAPDHQKFPAIAMAYQAMKKGGTLPCVMNAANEIAVAAFLNRQIKFIDMARVVEYTMEHATHYAKPTIETYQESDVEARRIAEAYIQNVSL